MTKKLINTVLVGVAVLVFASSAYATPIISYDVQNALPSGFGNWSHTYSGSIVGNNYSGGSGTLNDGIIPSSVTNNQLFRLTDSPTVTLYLPGLFYVTAIDLLGGLFGNYIPGTLTGWSVTINGNTMPFSSTGYQPGCWSGLCNDSVNLVGSGLELLATNAVTLSAFQGGWQGYFNIGEATVNAEPTRGVPEPGSSLLLLGMGLAAVAAKRLRK